jgi:7-cyano-7-deazaguanine synthase in queuosine biosynthesis
MQPDAYASRAPANLLWTGGWDSTFRLLQAALIEERTVQPHYVIDHKRRSVQCELAAMASIKQAIAAGFPDARVRILPTSFYERSEIPANVAVTASHRALLGGGFLGWQYDWLARLAAWRRIPRLELAIHRDDRAHGFIHALVAREPAGSFAVAPQSTHPAATLFRDFVFPILDMTKLEMGAIARAHGFYPILEQTWFCDSPDAKLRPCGACNPCRYTIKEGFGWRVPSSNRVRGEVLRVCSGVGRRIGTRLVRREPRGFGAPH